MTHEIDWIATATETLEGIHEQLKIQNQLLAGLLQLVGELNPMATEKGMHKLRDQLAEIFPRK